MVSNVTPDTIAGELKKIEPSPVVDPVSAQAEDNGSGTLLETNKVLDP